jgi:hypothetical protein
MVISDSRSTGSGPEQSRRGEWREKIRNPKPEVSTADYPDFTDERKKTNKARSPSYFSIRVIREIRGSLVQVVDFDQTDSGAAVLSS